MPYSLPIFLGLLLILGGCNVSANNAGDISSTQQDTIIQKQEKILYIDVREDHEWTAGHIEGAIHVKLGDIEAGKLSDIPKDIPIALYCRSGRRSGIAHDILKTAGYTKVTNAGGMEQIRGVKIVR